MDDIARVVKYLRPYRTLAAVSVAAVFAYAMAGLVAPWPLKIIVDNILGDNPLPSKLANSLLGVPHDRVALLIYCVIAGLVISLTLNWLNVFGTYVNTLIQQRMLLDLRSNVFQHAQRLSLAYHDQQKSASLIYAIGDQASAAAGLAVVIPVVVQSLLTLFGMFWVSFQMDPQIALLSLLVVPVLYFLARYYAKHIRGQMRRVKRMESEALGIVHEDLSLLRVIMAFGREDYEHHRFRGQGELAADARIQVTFRQLLFSLAVNLTTAAGAAMILGVGALHVLQGQLTVGQMLVMISYLAAVYKPLEAISNTAAALQDKLVSLQMIGALLNTEPDIKDLPAAVPHPHARGFVSFDKVCFGYAGRANVLQDITFEAQPGRVVAIVGPTGAGKTTLVSLIPRFHDPSRGRILIDEIDIRRLTLQSLRAQISLVLQDPLLFSGSIAENIRYGRLDARMDEITAAAKAANAHEFITRLSEQYETQLGEKGVRLSGGERQRISVARAFLKDAPILILDEPTSSVDSMTEEVILEALDRLMEGRTVFMIAHRLSTIRHADRILVMDHGALVEQGTHEELLQRGGFYKEMFEMQNYATRRAGAAATIELSPASPPPT